ncbi:Hpt domain-containing protein [Marinobacter xestospongiae]|uniref:hybrid sensor histidine kinase/response regulator n=1 Tax=Marinobacter xestospongiae TaxID=994319 RepID=UPI0020062C0A|nr:Hpt domain-containing protein [Marinobacter xestospongiae]MCK7566308.1 Hpt domain-containing protein [Marinobacter xestospongiae]
MGNHHDSIALDWVRGEIQDTLIQGQQALEAFVENRDDTARLRFCLNYLHQVHGTLKMVELYGAALLTEEMEQLTTAVLNESVANVDDAVEVLMQAILQLPQYLEHLGSSRDDFPLVLLPLLNDLRAARGEALLSDTSLFKPDLSPVQQPVSDSAVQRLQDPKVLGHLRKLRQMYQFALAGVVREENLGAQFDYLQKVIQRLVKLCQRTPREQLWRAAGGLVETLQSGDNPVNTAAKSILRELDNELRRLIEEHVDILQQPLPEAMFKHLLYYVARARGLDTPFVRELRKTFKLDDALPSEDDVSEARHRVSGPGREAIHSVVSALNEELAKLKDQLDLFVRAEFRQNDELGELLPGLRQVANTLAVLGLGIPRQVVNDQIDLVSRLSQQVATVDDGTLMDIAGALLYVEASLAGLDSDRAVETPASSDSGSLNLGSQELGEANTALLRESRNTLEQVKTAVVNFIASQWDQREIEHVPGLLHSICGGLRLVPLDRVADMLASAERYISDVLLTGKQVPDWKQLDSLADAITSIEYYLEHLAEGMGDSDSILSVASDSLASLGFPVGAEPTWQAEATVAEAADSEEETPAEALAATTAKESDAELLDDEILAIFVEEAEEVLDTIRNYYPRLRQHHDDHEALTEVRRAFHTLKGSGRLVGASSLGELAWSVENLLNRVIDQTVRASDDLFTLVDEVNERLPQLIQDFRQGRADGDVAGLIERAEALATTSKISADTAPAAAPQAANETVEAPVTEPDTADEAEAATVSAPEAEEDDLIDDEIVEIFIEEAAEVLDTIREFLPMLLRQLDDRSALTEIRRAFHTLKGSGRMVGANAVGELAWAVENMLNRVIDGSILMNENVARLLTDVTEEVPGLVKDFELRRPASIDTAPLESRANALANGDIPDTRSMPGADDDEHEQEPAETMAADGSDLSLDEDDLADPVLLDIFESEAETHLKTLQDFLESAGDKATASYTDDVSRALHTLKGSAHTASIDPIARVITPLERFVKDARAANLKADREALALMADACEFIMQGLAQIRENPQAELAGTDDFLERLAQLAAHTVGNLRETEVSEVKPKTDPQLVQLFLNEGLDILLDADNILDDWAGHPDRNARLDTLIQELQHLAQGGREVGLNDVTDLAGSLAAVYEHAKLSQVTPDADFFTTTKAGHDHLIDMMDQVAAGLATVPDEALMSQLQQLQEQLANSAASDELSDAFDSDLEAIDESLELTLPEQDDELPELPALDEDDDQELAAIFLEEARDLVDSTGEALQQWQSEPDNNELLRGLQRDLHTLKGGARLADIAPVGDLAHELETLFERLADGQLTANDTLGDLLFLCHDRLANMVDGIEQQQSPEPADELIAAIQGYLRGEQPEPQASPDADASADAGPGAGEGAADADSAATESAESGDSGLEGLDPELAEIFLEEAGEIINTSAELLYQWQEQPEQADLVKELQRELHTLKGGARMAEITPVADIAHEMETLFERIVEGRLAATPARTELALRAHDQLAAFVETIADRGACPAAPELLQALRDALSDDSPAPVGDTEIELELPEMPASAAEPEAAEIPEETHNDQFNLSELDPELVGIFLEEAYDLINSTGSALHSWSENPDNRDIAAELQRDVHTLKGGARMAGVDAIGDLTHVLEDLFEQVAEGRLAASEPMVNLLFACHDRLAQMVEQVATQKPCPPAQELVAEVRAVMDGAPVEAPSVKDAPAASTEAAASREQSPVTDLEPVDEDLIGIFLDEGLEIHEAINECLAQWREEPEQLTGITQLQQELHTLKGGARLADVDSVADLAQGWEETLEALISGTGNQDTVLQLSSRANLALKRMLATLEEGHQPPPETTLLEAFSEVRGGNEVSAPSDATAQDDDAPDLEVIEIFLEEAGELIDQLEQLLADWHKEPANNHFNQEAQRVLHTLKGGARLSQLPKLGDQAHGLESQLIALGGEAPDEATWQTITRDYDALVAQVGDVRDRYEQQSQAATPETPASKPATQPAPAPAATQVPAKPAKAKAPAAPKPAQPAAKKAKAANRGGNQESIRVSAPLLDELVNLAGETSITRGRLEQQTSDFGHTLDEMAATIERLREQLRRMDIETEAQILFRTEREHGPDYGDDFDPLEMDRYSSIQQLSRALSESSSDLADLRETLADRIRDTETLLVQQSRINTELQEGLMKTRMIPFASMVPRLRRIVRQISGELGKKVEFDVRNAEGEMDRNILERMIAPLEHMLRNALDHGIEAPADRQAAGKPDTGQVVLSLTREGGDVVLRMVDDGKGIPTSVIRDKAVRQGMMREDEDLSDREILQFILQPGFSTAQQVTQISGRGVGMDVVASEIKQLGGALDIESAVGRGTTFTVRLPFTVSVNRALMVSTGEDFYAIPLNTIEGIVRVSTYELEEYYKPEAPMYEYAGQQYRLQYLGSLLNSDHQPKLQGQALPLPVILVRGAEQPMALQVDSLMGSREIVVKSLGPQFSSVRGVSGATILGDGNVVVILDLPAMIRSDILSERQRLAEQEGAQESGRRDESATVVMVVDDSVTVRKVTSRLLERNGMEVVTAKDGLDAVAQLQDHRPDIILLDIEMPRMDGFEVASFVRHDEALRDTPICMITSRTGQKHRERALSIGVNEYLGKPFQESELLDTIERLTGDN